MAKYYAFGKELNIRDDLALIAEDCMLIIDGEGCDVLLLAYYNCGSEKETEVIIKGKSPNESAQAVEKMIARNVESLG